MVGNAKCPSHVTKDQVMTWCDQFATMEFLAYEATWKLIESNMNENVINIRILG